MKADFLQASRFTKLSPRTLILVFVVSVTVNVVALLLQAHLAFPTPRHWTYLRKDHPRELPMGKLRTVNMDFHDEIEHYDLYGARAWSEWASIIPPGLGYAYLGEEYFPFQVSMWHQMHCLNHIRALFVNGDDGSEHTQHCFQYLRSAILCAADLTLEEVGTGTILANGGETAPGEHITHTCKDWTQVHAWLSKEHEKWTPEMEKRLDEPSPAENSTTSQ